MALSNLTPGCLLRFFHSDRHTENSTHRWTSCPPNFGALALGLFLAVAICLANDACRLHPRLAQTSTGNSSFLAWFALTRAIKSCMVGVAGVIIACWYHGLLKSDCEPPAKNRMALPAIIDRLESCTYEQVVGDKKQLYPAECAICLAAWEQLDKIKMTPCKHTFHEECLASWLTNADTCALCRLDLVNTDQEHKCCVNKL